MRRRTTVHLIWGWWFLSQAWGVSAIRPELELARKRLGLDSALDSTGGGRFRSSIEKPLPIIHALSLNRPRAREEEMVVGKMLPPKQLHEKISDYMSLTYPRRDLKGFWREEVTIPATRPDGFPPYTALTGEKQYLSFRFQTRNLGNFDFNERAVKSIRMSDLLLEVEPGKKVAENEQLFLTGLKELVVELIENYWDMKLTKRPLTRNEFLRSLSQDKQYALLEVAKGAVCMTVQHAYIPLKDSVVGASSFSTFMLSAVFGRLMLTNPNVVKNPDMLIKDRTALPFSAETPWSFISFDSPFLVSAEEAVSGDGSRAIGLEPDLAASLEGRTAQPSAIAAAILKQSDGSWVCPQSFAYNRTGSTQHCGFTGSLRGVDEASRTPVDDMMLQCVAFYPLNSFVISLHQTEIVTSSHSESTVSKEWVLYRCGRKGWDYATLPPDVGSEIHSRCMTARQTLLARRDWVLQPLRNLLTRS